MAKTKYNAAVISAKKKLQHSISCLPPHSKVCGEIGAFQLKEGGADALYFLAGHDPISFDCLRFGIAELLDEGEELSADAKAWLVRFLRNEVTRPKEKSGRNSEAQLHLIISEVIRELMSDGMNATRNDASEALSACDAVADALAELKLQPATFHGVKRLWLENRRALRLADKYKRR